MRGRALLTLLLCVATGACKEKQHEAPRAETPASPKQAPGERPALPAQPAAPAAATPPAEKPAQKPVTVADAKAVLPAIQGTEVIALKPTSDNLQIHGTWCIDGTSADDVARQVGQWLTQAGYANVSTRGDAKKAGVSGDKDVMRFSMVVSASSAAVCAAPAHYFASATIYRP